MKKIYVVFGPFRSGTSLISRLLSIFGADAGPESDLFEPSSWNPAGYFQRPDITSFNTELINISGKDISNPPDPIELSEIVRKQHFDKLDLDWMIGRKNIFIKDPRFCITLNAWVKHEILMNRELRMVRITRNINDVVKSSLLHYDVRHYCGNSKSSATKVIERYEKFSEWHYKNIKAKSILIDYQELMRCPEIVIDEIAKFMQVSSEKQKISALNAIKSGKSKVTG